MNEPQKNAALRARYREIQETRAKARETARRLNAQATGKPFDPIADASSEVERIQARETSRETARQLTQRRNN